VGFKIRGKFQPKFGARHQRHVAGSMNKQESAYRLHLDAKKAAGEIIDFGFETFKIRLADNTFYTPDFVVFAPDGLEFHEVKGVWSGQKKPHFEDDARVKIKVAAEQNPLCRFVAVYRLNGVWCEEEF